ncbi:hypothetical protein AVEN_45498-1 [Araneus ventricosus]|uniref:Uncharacterized protein n=1 Tax=Araneus ventricosus TaxID=182803 RepID=A0A4Y2JN62_ARAVE|nr:hypothetical protein AVEN_45498-1 [Araneus ventricosus]
MQFASGIRHFPNYLKSFNLHLTDNGETGDFQYIATSCPLTTSYHHKKPSPQYTAQWWRNALTNKRSRGWIDILIKFLTTKEHLIKSHYRQDDTDSDLDLAIALPPRTRQSSIVHSNNEVSQFTH